MQSPTHADEKPESLGLDEVETRVKAACAVVGADYSMTMNEVLQYIPSDTVYAYAHTKGEDLTVVVKQVMQRSMAIDEGLDVLSTNTKVDRKLLEPLLNWFDVFDYAITHKQPLIEVMEYAVRSNAAHLLGEADTAEGNDSTQDDDGSKPKVKNKREFDLELQRLRKLRGLPDGKSLRSEQQSDRQRKKRDAKVNQSRGFVSGVAASVAGGVASLLSSSK